MKFNVVKKQQKKVYLDELEDKEDSWKPPDELVKEWENYFDNIFGKPKNPVKNQEKCEEDFK